MTALVLTVIGDDQPGLVDRLSGIIVEHGGNWDTSHLSRLAGKFAGIVLITVPDRNTDEFIKALEPVEAQGLLDITVTQAAADEPNRPSRQLSLELVGQDHPGIIHDISHALAEHSVSIKELQTETTSAPMAGGMLFSAWVLLEVPEALDTASVRAGLEALANELMVDIDVREGVDDEPER